MIIEKLVKRYNKQTKGYKIDIFGANKNSNNYFYIASTDIFKTCKEAIKNFKSKNKSFSSLHKIKANFDYDTYYVNSNKKNNKSNF